VHADAYGNKQDDEALWLVCCGFHRLLLFVQVNYGNGDEDFS
jgi:hypothetical protein